MRISRTKQLMMMWPLLCISFAACETPVAPATALDLMSPAMAANTSTSYVRITKPAVSTLKVNDSLVLVATSTRVGRLSVPTWESRSPARATVGASTGKVIGKLVGPVTIVARSVAGIDSVVLSVTSGTTTTTPALSVSPSTVSVDSGKTATLTANAAGTWSSSNTQVATVSTGGVVTGIKPGTASVTLQNAAGATATASVTVLAVGTTAPPPPPPPSPAPSIVELPRVYLDGMLARARSATASRTINVSTSGALQAAIDTARFGDEIVLQANTTYTGAFYLRKKTTGAGWITIRSANNTVPAGTRARPSTSTALPKVLGGSSGTPVFTADAGAHNYRLLGFEVSSPSSLTTTYSLIQIGAGGTPTTQPDSIVLDRMYIHGTAQLNFQRCVLMNSGSTVVVDSWLSECHGKGFDSQAIVGWNGTGPYKIENNYLEGAGENVMFGGADPSSVAMIPSDIEIRGNHFFKPLSWKNVWSVKNSFELKMGHRILVEGNIFENNWVDGQNGTAIVLKSVNQGGGAPFSETRDLTFRYNIVRNTQHALAAAGKPEVNPAVPMSHLLISNNLFENIGDPSTGRLWLVTNVSDLTFEYNTGFATTHGLYMLLPKANNLRVENNVFGVSQASFGSYDQTVLADGVGYGTVGLNASYTSWVYSRNVNPMTTGSRFPLGNYQPSAFSAVGFLSWPANLQLTSSSPFKSVSTAGTSVGVDYTQLNSKTAQVVQTP